MKKKTLKDLYNKIKPYTRFDVPEEIDFQLWASSRLETETINNRFGFDPRPRNPNSYK